MASLPFRAEMRWRRRWRLGFGVAIMRVGAWVAEGAGATVTVNGKPWMAYRPEFALTVKIAARRLSAR